MVLQTGVPKSGNYWVYTILEYLYNCSGRPLSKFITSQDIPVVIQENFHKQLEVDALNCNLINGRYYWRVSSQYKQPIPDLIDYTKRAQHIWTHSFYHHYLDPLLMAQQKIIHIVRDPRDVLISQACFQTRKSGKSPEYFFANHTEKLFSQWYVHTVSYLRAAHKYSIFTIRYEDLLNNFEITIRDFVRYLDLSISEVIVGEMNHLFSFDHMKTLSPKHLRAGTANQWKSLGMNFNFKGELEQMPKIMKLYDYA